MPRKSSAALSIIPITSARKRISPPTDLSRPEADLFRAIAAQCAPDHFTESDGPLLVSYCQATLLSRRAAKELAAGNSKALLIWDRATRMQSTLSTRLRLAPQSRSDPKTVSRKLANHRPSAYEDL